MRSSRHVALAALALLSCLTGCQSSYPAASSQYLTATVGGGHAAAAEVAADAAKSDPASETLWMLELASAQRANGDIAASARTFERAEARFREIDSQPDLALGRETLSSLSDPYRLPYRGRNLDRIFAATYQAIDHLQLGETDKARVSLTRSLFRQEDARRRREESLKAAADESSSLGREDSQMGERLADPSLAAARDAVTARFDGKVGYPDAMNPFAVWLNGIYYLHTAEGPADLERARKSLQTAATLCPGDRFIAADLALAEHGAARPDPGAGRTIVHVVHEVGMAPAWGETRLTLPLIYADSRAPMVRIALPTISPQGETPSPTELTGGEATARLVTLADVDAIVRNEFEEEYPRARNRAIASATMKATLGYIANREAQKDDKSGGANLLAIATLLATNSYAIQSARADLRNWSSLPREVRHGRVEIARGGTVRLTGGWMDAGTECRIPAARAVLVTIRSISPGTPAIIRTSILQP